MRIFALIKSNFTVNGRTYPTTSPCRHETNILTISTDYAKIEKEFQKTRDEITRFFTENFGENAVYRESNRTLTEYVEHFDQHWYETKENGYHVSLSLCVLEVPEPKGELNASDFSDGDIVRLREDALDGFNTLQARPQVNGVAPWLARVISADVGNNNLKIETIVCRKDCLPANDIHGKVYVLPANFFKKVKWWI